MLVLLLGRPGFRFGAGAALRKRPGPHTERLVFQVLGEEVRKRTGPGDVSVYSFRA